MTRTNRYSYYVLGVLVLGYTVNYLDRYILSILLPAIKADLGLSDAMLGFLVGPAFAVVYASAGIPVARLAETRGQTPPIIAQPSACVASAAGPVQESLTTTRDPGDRMVNTSLASPGLRLMQPRPSDALDCVGDPWIAIPPDRLIQCRP